MPGPAVGKFVNRIQLLRREGPGGRVLHHPALSRGLHQRASRKGILLFISKAEGLTKGIFALLHLFKSRKKHALFRKSFTLFKNVAGTGNVPEGVHRHPLLQKPGDLHYLQLPHAVDEEIRSAIHQKGTPHLSGPVVVVGKTAQTCLNPSDNEGNIFPELPHPIAVYQGSPIRPESPLASGGVAVGTPGLSRCSAVIQQGIQISRSHQHPKPGFPQGGKILQGVPIRLGEYGHPESPAFENPADDGGTEAGMIHVGISRNKEKVRLFPSQFTDLLRGGGKKGSGLFSSVTRFFSQSLRLLEKGGVP
jgi:hypothetical protein